MTMSNYERRVLARLEAELDPRKVHKFERVGQGARRSRWAVHVASLSALGTLGLILVLVGAVLANGYGTAVAVGGFVCAVAGTAGLTKQVGWRGRVQRAVGLLRRMRPARWPAGGART